MSNAIQLSELSDFSFKMPENQTLYSKSFLDRVKELNKLPFNHGDFYFSNDIWDFTPYKVNNVMDSRLKFNFEDCPEEFRDVAKGYVLVTILNKKKKLSSVWIDLSYIKRFLNIAIDKSYLKIEDISEEFIRNFLKTQQENLSPSTYELVLTGLRNLYTYYFSFFNKPSIKTKIKLFAHVQTKAQKAEREARKFPDIPKQYYDKFLDAILKIIDNETEDPLMRNVAAFYLILSQTGLRISECLALEINQLESISIFNGETAYYLNYKTWKREKGDNVFSWSKTYVNALTKKGYDFLTTAYAEKRNKCGTNILFLGSNYQNSFPINNTSFAGYYYRFFIHLNKYFPTVNLPDNTYPNIKNKNISVTALKESMPEVAKVAAPDNHQFRVHVCTELYSKGVPLKYVEKFMSHLSAEMSDYYVRPTKQNPQENMEFTLDTLKKIVIGETKLLGGNNGLQIKINEFIEKNNYNVETDLQAICEKLAENIPIRQKTGGVCIKSSMLRECSKDSKTNEFYCAYGVCPNIFHFYYMANVSYRQTKELIETIAINENRGLLRQVQKEKNMLHHIVKVKLVPELDELKNVLSRKGYEAVVTEYPDLKEIVENLDSIYQEVEAWNKMN